MRNRVSIDELFSARFVTAIVITCLSIAPLAMHAAPESRAAGPDDLGRFQHASSPDGKNINDYIERGLHKEAKGDFNGALTDYSTAIAIAPNSELAHYHRGVLYSALGRFGDAIADLDTVIRQNPREAGVYLIRGNAHSEMGHASTALADYDDAIRYATNTPNGNRTEAKAYYEKGDYAKAALQFARAKQKSPRDDLILNGIAWFKATCPDKSLRNGRDALKDSKKACELTKWENGPRIDTLAASYAEVGDFVQAVKYQKQAISLTSTTPNTARGMQMRLRLYEGRKPFREEPRLRKSRT